MSAGKVLPFPAVPIVGQSGVAITFLFRVPPGIEAQAWIANLLTQHLMIAPSVCTNWLVNIQAAVRPLTDLTPDTTSGQPTTEE